MLIKEDRYLQAFTKFASEWSYLQLSLVQLPPLTKNEMHTVLIFFGGLTAEIPEDLEESITPLFL